MALSDEEKSQLAALQAKEQEPEDNGFDVEIWDETGAGAKVPYNQAKTWLARFGIGLPEPSEGEADPKGSKPKTGGSKGPAATDNVTHAAKYFGNKQAS
jgi:hypothetical protein